MKRKRTVAWHPIPIGRRVFVCREQCSPGGRADRMNHVTYAPVLNVLYIVFVKKICIIIVEYAIMSDHACISRPRM
jgi:hypothetical protein